MIARSRITMTAAAGAALLAASPVVAQSGQDDGVSRGLSGYAIGLGAAALGVLAIVLADGGNGDSTNPNSP